MPVMIDEVIAEAIPAQPQAEEVQPLVEAPRLDPELVFLLHRIERDRGERLWTD